MTTYLLAIDSMFAHCKSAWDSSCLVALEQQVELRYQGVEGDKIPEVDEIWGRAAIRTVSQERANVGQLNDSGAARYRSRGLVSIEVFAPKIKSGSFHKARNLAATLRTHFLETKTNEGVVLRNPRIDDFYYMDLQWYRVMLVCEYEFDEIL